MAQTGYTPILIYASSTGGNTPTAGSLTNSTLGSELAINITDGKLFYKDNANAVQVIGWKTTPTTAGGTGLTSYAAGDLLYYASGTTLTKLAIGSAYQALQVNASGTAPSWQASATSTLTAQGDLLYASAANTLARLAKNTTATRYLSNTGSSNNPAWAQIDLTNGVTGTLPVGNGGTGQTSWTANGVLYASGTTTLASGSALTFNGTNLATTGSIQSGSTISVGGATPSTSGAGVTFPASQSASTNANTLDDYEEGTWTPAYSASGLSGVTYGTFNGGTYTKIGNTVVAWFTIYTFGTFTKGTGAVGVTGLPFTSASVDAWSTGATFGNLTRWDANPPIAGRLDQTSTTMALYSNIRNTGGGVDPTAVQGGDMRSAAGENCNYVQGCIVYRV